MGTWTLSTNACQRLFLLNPLDWSPMADCHVHERPLHVPIERALHKTRPAVQGSETFFGVTMKWNYSGDHPDRDSLVSSHDGLYNVGGIYAMTCS